jgi:hypothetical protein
LSGKIVLTIRSRKRVLSDLAIKKESIVALPQKRVQWLVIGKADWHRLLLQTRKDSTGIRSRKRVLPDLVIKKESIVTLPRKRVLVGSEEQVDC